MVPKVSANAFAISAATELSLQQRNADGNHKAQG